MSVKREVEALIKALEAGTHAIGAMQAPDKFTCNLLNTLYKLSISKNKWYAPMKFEGLEAILNSTTFDDSKIKLHKKSEKDDEH